MQKQIRRSERNFTGKGFSMGHFVHNQLEEVCSLNMKFVFAGDLESNSNRRPWDAGPSPCDATNGENSFFR